MSQKTAEKIHENENEKTDSSKKRGRSETSSLSEMDSSINTPPSKIKEHQRKDKRSKPQSQKNEKEINLSQIQSQLSEINKKLSNVITKDDGNLREMIREMIQQLKNELLQSVERKLEILESRLFDKEKENDALKKDVKKLNTKLEEQYEENSNIRYDCEKNNDSATDYLNDLEQYSRANNIRINGISEDQKESDEKTTEKVVETLNKHIKDLKITAADIDISHRLGKKKGTNKRQIIVRFVKRSTKNKIMSNLKLFKGSKLFISEDLTQLNHHVLLCVKRKMEDEIKSVWTRGGKIMYQNKTGNIHRVHFKEYKHWMDLPWPEDKEKGPELQKTN